MLNTICSHAQVQNSLYREWFRSLRNSMSREETKPFKNKNALPLVPVRRFNFADVTIFCSELNPSAANLQSVVFLVREYPLGSCGRIRSLAIHLNCTGKCLGPPTSLSYSSERTLFGTMWEMLRIFGEISCGHFPWRLKGENLRKIWPKLLQTKERGTRNGHDASKGFKGISGL